MTLVRQMAPSVALVPISERDREARLETMIPSGVGDPALPGEAQGSAGGEIEFEPGSEHQGIAPQGDSGDGESVRPGKGKHGYRDDIPESMLPADSAVEPSFGYSHLDVGAAADADRQEGGVSGGLRGR